MRLKAEEKTKYKKHFEREIESIILRMEPKLIKALDRLSKDYLISFIENFSDLPKEYTVKCRFIPKVTIIKK